jgi:hypothetical protein
MKKRGGSQAGKSKEVKENETGKKKWTVRLPKTDRQKHMQEGKRGGRQARKQCRQRKGCQGKREKHRHKKPNNHKLAGQGRK